MRLRIGLVLLILSLVAVSAMPNIAAAAASVEITSPQAGATVTSPLRINGFTSEPTDSLNFRVRGALSGDLGSGSFPVKSPFDPPYDFSGQITFNTPTAGEALFISIWADGGPTASVAVVALIGGFAALRYMPGVGSGPPARTEAARKIWSGALPTGMRVAMRMQPGAFPPTPPPATMIAPPLLLDSAPLNSSAEVAALPPASDGVEGSVSFPAAPPPAAEKSTPLPPLRPADLAELAIRFAESAAATPAEPTQAETAATAPPAGLQQPSARAALETTPAGPAEAAHPTQVARAARTSTREGSWIPRTRVRRMSVPRSVRERRGAHGTRRSCGDVSRGAHSCAISLRERVARRAAHSAPARRTRR